MIRYILAALLLASAAQAKEEKKVEHGRDRITVKSKDSKGSWKTEREFPLMFANNRKAGKK
jgi:hypothetical protein